MEAVDAFLRQLAAYALRDALKLGGQASPVKRLEMERDEYFKGKKALKQGTRLSHALLASRC
jgi:hypothetical protein